MTPVWRAEVGGILVGHCAGVRYRLALPRPATSAPARRPEPEQPSTLPANPC